MGVGRPICEGVRKGVLAYGLLVQAGLQILGQVLSKCRQFFCGKGKLLVKVDGMAVWKCQLEL